MKKFLFFLTMVGISVLVAAQTPSRYNQVMWLNGRIMYAQPVSSIDSLTYANEIADIDTLHLLLPRRVVHTQHDTIVIPVHDTIDLCDKGIGVFSVSADKQVAFARGNLQYQPIDHTWRFAEHQYDLIGGINGNISASFDGWIDLFGWGTGDNPTNASTEDEDYPTFVDWGINVINSEAPGKWRTLTLDEWQYLFMHTRWTMAGVNGLLGFMLFPDGVDIEGLNIIGDGNLSSGYVKFETSDFAPNNNTYERFAQLEALGCVFLPCAGSRSGSTVSSVALYGYYWSSTSVDDGDYASGLCFMPTCARILRSFDFYIGRSVRLVLDIK